MAPPVTMIGPSAPNGADEPMATAAEIGLGDRGPWCDPALFGEHRLHRLRDAVAVDDRCPFGEAADDEGADHGDDHDARSARASRRRAGGTRSDRTRPGS